MNKLFLLASALLVTFCAGVAPTVHPKAGGTPGLHEVDWRTKVTAAKALEDPTQRNEAMLDLLREALVNREVRLSGLKHADNVHPEDNVPAPIVNFDPRLQQKRSATPRSGGPTRSLQNNFGYYFSVSGTPYVVLGPAALDPRSPFFTRLAAEHELFHAENHVGDPRQMNDRELETWSQMLVTYFRDIHQFKQHWRPMLTYYENASEGERQKAIERLATYYRNADATVRAAFEEWLTRRKADTASSKLVNDLESAIKS